MEDRKQLTWQYKLTPGASNAAKRLPVSLLITQIIDIATAHANLLGFGSELMDPMGIGWVLSRVTVEMTAWPITDSNYSITTWIESWNRRFSNRCFRIDDAEGFPMGFVRTIWMVIDVNTHRGLTTDALTNFHEGLVSETVCPIPTQEKHPQLERADDVQVCEYRFRYTDIDFYRHVNTVKYIELLLNQYTLEEFDRYSIRRLEVAFMREARYGEIARIHRRDLQESQPAADFTITICDTPILRARVRLMPA